jgi:two-component system, sensor histidine kinase
MSSRARKYRILVVDDESSVLTTYRMILEQKGYDVIAASSSEEARRALDGSKLDLLLCDLSLEEKDSGFEVISFARDRQPALPSLLLTGYASKEVSDRAERDGISVLFKPIDIQEFLSTIATALRNAHEEAKASSQ